QPETGAPPSARLRRRIGLLGRRGSVHLGPRQGCRAQGRAQARHRPARRRSPRAARPGGSPANRLPRRRRRLRLGEPRAGARQAPRGIGRVRYCAPQRRAGRTGRRARRPVVRPGQPGALRQGRPRAGPAPHQCEIPHPLEPHRSPPERTGPPTQRCDHRRNGGSVAGSEAQVAPIEIRQLFDREEFEGVVALQKTIWSFADAELLPLRFLVVVSKVGGHVFGAYDGPRMIGFCFAIPGIKPDGRPYLHSHMLGVLPEYRNAQVGRRLKLHQRDDALARGIALIEWTFDPLELKNAYLNIERLGAIVRVYKENQYGTTSSPLHGGLPTDRCIAEWWIDSPRVHSIFSGPRSRPAATAGRISYPADIDAIRQQDTARSRAIQQANARLFLDAFERGLAVTGFERTAAEGTYLLAPWQ